MPETDSTNQYLKKLDLITDGIVCISDYQTAGRGQKPNVWISEREQNLTFSVMLKPENAERVHLLKQVAAISVADVIRDRISAEVYLKWPNDVLVNDRKIAGVLVECTFSGNHLEKALLGIGLNVFQTLFPNDLSTKATSLRLLDPTRQFNRELILAAILSRIEYYYDLWKNAPMELVTRINPMIIGYGKWCKIVVDEKPAAETYKILGMTQNGYLRALSESMEVVTYTQEDVHIYELD